jgi:hypothetical protein
MSQWLNNLLDRISEFLASRKGLLPVVGILLIVLNLIFQFLPFGWLKDSNLFFHLGVIVAILGFMLARAL